MIFLTEALPILNIIYISDRPNIPCSAERSVECSVIFGPSRVPLFNGGTGGGKKEPLFLAFFAFFFIKDLAESIKKSTENSRNI